VGARLDRTSLAVYVIGDVEAGVHVRHLTTIRL